MAERPPRIGVAAWLHEMRRGWWSIPLIGAALTALMVDFGKESWSTIAEALATNCWISLCIGGSVTAVYTIVLSRLDWSNLHPMIRGALHLLALTVGVGVGTEIAIATLALVYGAIDRARLRWMLWRIGGVVGAIVMIVSIAYDRLKERARAVELRAEQDRRELLKAQLETLQARTNPHFLFNSLNTVASLIEDDPDRAVEAVERLSALLRYSLEGAKTQRVPLRREVDALIDYLALEGLRYGERLKTDLKIDDACRAVEVPPFILQPIVENAVKHGIAKRREGGRVTVVVTHDGESVRVCVDDDGPGVSDHVGTQTGEAGIRERLRIVYGDAASFESGPRPQGGYRVEMRVPGGSPA